MFFKIQEKLKLLLNQMPNILSVKNIKDNFYWLQNVLGKLPDPILKFESVLILSERGNVIFLLIVVWHLVTHDLMVSGRGILSLRDLFMPFKGCC